MITEAYITQRTQSLRQFRFNVGSVSKTLDQHYSVFAGNDSQPLWNPENNKTRPNIKDCFYCFSVLTQKTPLNKQWSVTMQWLNLPAWKVKDRGFEPRLVSKKQMFLKFLPCSLVKIPYCGTPLWPRDSVLGLRPPGIEFRIPCLEGSVISFISPSSGGSHGPA